jgi:uncharacterized protein YuzE
MRLEYDLDVGALYIALTESPVARTREHGDNANVDLDAGGNVVGIEVISAAHRWPLREILSAYAIAETDAAQLRSYFLAQVAGGHAQPDVPPAIEAQPDALPAIEAEPTGRLPKVLQAA